MKKWPTVLICFTLALAIAAGCASVAPTSTPTATAVPTPTVTPTPTPTPSPTPLPAKEWTLEDIQVDGSTVTVLLRVYAGIDVRVTLDGRSPDQANASSSILEFIFQNVALGKHAIQVRDVVGYEETEEVVVPIPTTKPDALPEWLANLIQSLENAPVGNPPASITQYVYKGQTVYFLPQRCCDIFSDLYDANGNIIGHPDGGITGQGDGRAPDFFDERTNAHLIWQDKRTYDPSLVQVPAPIVALRGAQYSNERVKVLVMESFPPQYSVVVVSGLPNGCVSFGGYLLERDGDMIQIELINWKPADPATACTEEYRTVEHNIWLGSDFESGRTYTAIVNGIMETFVAQ